MIPSKPTKKCSIAEELWHNSKTYRSGRSVHWIPEKKQGKQYIWSRSSNSRHQPAASPTDQYVCPVLTQRFMRKRQYGHKLVHVLLLWYIMSRQPKPKTPKSSTNFWTICRSFIQTTTQCCELQKNLLELQIWFGINDDNTTWRPRWKKANKRLTNLNETMSFSKSSGY
jgi:hypothetical protein